MKFVKPQFKHYVSIPQCIWAFLDSLPDQFEVVPDGHVCVKWPSDCTKGHLEVAARNLSYNAETSEGAAKHMLRALAAIAPVEKKKRKVTLWQHETAGWQRWTEHEGTDYAIWLKSGWRKVGECEVDA